MDTQYLDRGNLPKDLVNQKLFNVSGNNWSVDDLAKLTKAAHDHPEYQWWINWLLAMHDGTFRDWDLAYRIATEIPEEIWQQGAKSVAIAIDRLANDRTSFRNARPEHQIDPIAFSASEIRKSLETRNLRAKELNRNAMDCLLRAQADLDALEENFPSEALIHTKNELSEISASLTILDQYLPEGVSDEDTQHDTIGKTLQAVARKLLDLSNDEEFLRNNMTIGLVGIVSIVVCTIAPAAAVPLSAYLGGVAFKGNVQISIGKKNKQKAKEKTKS